MAVRRPKQLSFLKNKSIYASWKQLGGTDLKSHPKRKRPISTRHEIHLVMKAKLAPGMGSMRAIRHQCAVNGLVRSLAKRFRIRISRYENVGNHLHLLIKVSTHEEYNKFVRGLSSAIARHMTGATRSAAKGLRFWESRPFTRIVTWGRDRLGLISYLNGNRIQAIGFSVFVKESELGYHLTG